MNTAEKTVTLAEALDQVQIAQETYVTCQVREREASSATVEALNRVNAAQKQFDAVVASVRTTSPREADWARQRKTEIREA